MGASFSRVLPGTTKDFVTVRNELLLDSITEIWELFAFVHNLAYLGCPLMSLSQ